MCYTLFVVNQLVIRVLLPDKRMLKRIMKSLKNLIMNDAKYIHIIFVIVFCCIFMIRRTFSYGGAHNVKMYDESTPLNINEDYSELNGNDPSTIHHFYHKLFKLKDNMNTKTAKEQAIKRTDYMQDFVEEFLDEWHGVR